MREVVTAVADGRRPAQDRAQLTDDPARMLRLVGELDAELTEQSKTIGATATDVVFLDRNGRVPSSAWPGRSRPITL